MRGFRCWWDGFYGTWLAPSTWGLRLRTGYRVREDGHWWGDTRYEVVSRPITAEEEPDPVLQEVEYATCGRCGITKEQGWRRFPGRSA